MKDMERCLPSLHCPLIVPYKASHAGRVCFSKVQQGGYAWVRGSPAAGSPAVLSSSSRPHQGPRSPSESFIILSAVTPPPLINACPGVFSSEAEAALFKTARLIDGRALGGTHSSRSKCLHSSFPHPLFSARPLGHSFLECAAACLSYTHHLCGLFITTDQVSSRGSWVRLAGIEPWSCINLGKSFHLLLLNL